MVCGRPAAVECSSKTSYQHAWPLLWSFSHSSWAWCQQACINKVELTTHPQKDGWLNLLWFAVVLPWASALYNCAHHVQLQDKYTHSLPLDPRYCIQSLTKACQASALPNNIKVEKGWFTEEEEEEKPTLKNFSSGALCFSKIFSRISKHCFLLGSVYKHVVQCVIKHQGQSCSSQSFWHGVMQHFHSSVLPPVHDVLFDQGEGLPFSDSSPSTAVVKFTSKFKWRLKLPAHNLFPFPDFHTQDLFCGW